MATIELKEDNFEKTVDQKGIVLVDFWAAWCGPCRAFAPVFEAASNTHADITFAKVDTEDQRRIAASFQISAIPALMVFRDGIIVYSEAGALPGSALEKLIGAVRALDMDHVRAEVEKQSAAAPA